MTTARGPRRVAGVVMTVVVLVLIVVGYRRDAATLERRIEQVRASAAVVVIDPARQDAAAVAAVSSLGGDETSFVVGSGFGGEAPRPTVSCIRVTVKPHGGRARPWFWLRRSVSFRVGEDGRLTDDGTC